MHIASYTTEAIQHAIAQGAITEAYQADLHQVIAALNQLRATEGRSAMGCDPHLLAHVTQWTG